MMLSTVSAAILRGSQELAPQDDASRVATASRVRAKLPNHYRVIWSVQPFAEKSFACLQPQITSVWGHPVPARGAYRDRHGRGARGCDGRRRFARRAEWLRTAKSCGPDAPTLASSCCDENHSGDGGKKARSPGRARSKPSNHCAGKAGLPPLTCMLMCVCCYIFAHETAGAARTRLSLRPLVFEGQ
jgi:hypothetical protein